MKKDLILFTNNLQEAIREIKELGGRVPHILADNVLVAHIPESVDPKSLKNAQVDPPATLTKASQDVMTAWETALTDAGKEVPDEGKSWGHKDLQRPQNAYNTEELTKKRDYPLYSSLYMTNKIVVGVVIVSGMAPGLAFSEAEINLIKSQVLQGANFLQGQDYRARIEFQYDFQTVTVDVPNSTSCPTFESCEGPWRQAALKKLGYRTSLNYVYAIIDAKDTNWGYVAYFTKYKLRHYAYASGFEIVMNYNDVWWPSHIYKIFAYASCHIFGAADEYGDCTCSPSGENQIPNLNCVHCATPQLPHAECLMDSDTLTLCTWTRGQLGWAYFKETNLKIADFAAWATTPGAQVITGDFNGNGKTDIALVGGTGWATQPVAFSNGDGTFKVTNAPITDFAAWATTPGAQVITGDFNGNGKTDIALVGGTGWTTQPVAFSNGDGTFNVTNVPIADFAAWATIPGAQVITGDFNGNGKTDIALVGGKGWATQPVAFSNGDGTFDVSNAPIADFAAWAATLVAQVITGDFSGNGKTDIALVGGKGRATTSGGRIITGDFNGNGKTDIALVGGKGWTTQPVAFSNGDGTFNVTNVPIADFAAWATTPGAQVITGDFNGNGKTDIALVGGKGWATQPVAFSNGDGTFKVTNAPIADFAALATTPGAQVITCDFNGSRKTDIALVGGNGWQSIPVAFSYGDGTYGVSNINVQNFAEWATTPGAKAITGVFNDNERIGIALVGGTGWETLPIAYYEKGSYEMGITV